MVETVATGPASPLWMLFSSGNSAEIHINSYPAPPGSIRPINSYLLTDCDGDCEEATRRAVECAWQFSHGIQKNLTSQVLGFDLKGRKPGSPVVGGSGGLALAIAAFAKINSSQFLPIAATGILPSTELHAPLLEVQGIIPKLEAALILVPEGGLVFYPERNDYEIPEDLKAAFQNRSIVLKSITSVQDAFLFLQGVIREKPRQIIRKKNHWFMIISVIVTFLLATVFYITQTNFNSAKVEIPLPETQPVTVQEPPQPSYENLENQEGQSKPVAEHSPPEVNQEPEVAPENPPRSDLSKGFD